MVSTGLVHACAGVGGVVVVAVAAMLRLMFSIMTIKIFLHGSCFSLLDGKGSERLVCLAMPT